MCFLHVRSSFHYKKKVGRNRSTRERSKKETNFQIIQPVNIVQTDAEKSIGSNADLQFNTQLGEVSLSMNQLFFFTHLNEPLILRDSQLVNADGHLQSAGFETNLRRSVFCRMPPFFDVLTHSLQTFGYRAYARGAEGAVIELIVTHRLSAKVCGRLPKSYTPPLCSLQPLLCSPLRRRLRHHDVLCPPPQAGLETRMARRP